MTFLTKRSRGRTLSGLLLVVALLLAPLTSSFAGQAGPLRFAVIGDSGTGDTDQLRLAHQMLVWHTRLPYSLVLMLGDNIYGGFMGSGGGDKKDFEKKFDRPYAPLLERGVIFRAALGNHDMRHRDGRDLIEAHDRFHIDGPLGYYSFTAGHWTTTDGREAPLVEFFVINTIRLEHDKKDPKQIAWLKEALAKSRARWRILYGHHPLYSTGKAHGGDPGLRSKLVPLLHGREPTAPSVHVVFAGHDHIYQRFHPLLGIVYFVDGSSGQLRQGDAQPSPLLAASEDQKNVFMLWEATADELSFLAINQDGVAFDCGTIDAGAVQETVCPAPAVEP